MKSRSIGIDINNDGIIIIELTRCREKLDLSVASVKKWGDGMISPALCSAWRSVPIVIAASTSQTLHKVISINQAMKDSEISYHLSTEANRYFSHHGDTLLIDFIRLKKHDNCYEVLACAIPKNIVNPSLANLQKFKLTPSIIEIECYALWRIILYAQPSLAIHKPTAFLRSHGGLLQLFIMKNHQLLFFREEKLATESYSARQWMQSFLASSSHETIAGCYVFSGESPDIIATLQQDLSDPLITINPDLLQDLPHPPCFFALAMGLALRGLS